MRAIQGMAGAVRRRNCGGVNNWPATDLARDILSPRPRNCIHPRQQWDRRDVSIEYRVLGLRRSRPGATALFAAALGLWAATASAAETITVEGNHRIDAETVRTYFHAASDGRYDEPARDAALKALIATNLFDKVTIDRAAGGLVVHVTEAKVIGRVAFEGNKKVKDADLTAAVQSKARGPLQGSTVQGDTNRIIEAYRRVGRDDVIVVPEIIDRGNDRVDLVFTITESKKTPVQKITFVGNHAFSNRQLNAVIKTSASSMLSFITGGDVYDPDRINEDREQIRLYYRSHGYADAAVPAAHAEYDPATKGFAVTFNIDEGQPYRFGKVDIVCNVPGLDPQKLRGRLLVK